MPPALTGAGRAVEDRNLIDRVIARDEDAFRALVERHAPGAQSLALGVLRDPSLAQEATQEAFLAIWQRPERYDADRGTVRSWLMGIVHHRAVDRTRREQQQRNVAMSSNHQVEQQADIAEGVVAAEGLADTRAMIRDALGRLPDEQRQVVELMYFGGFSQSEIASAYEIPLGTVKGRCLLAMRKLQSALTAMA